MPKPLDEETVDEIWEKYQELGTYKDVAEELGHDQETVSKYVKQRKERLAAQQSRSETPEGEPPSDYTAEPPSGSDPSDDPMDNPNFSTMSEGDFIEWFFNQSGHGVKENFAKNLAQNCEIRGEIPDQNEFANRLMSQKSGIANDADVSMMAETYWAVAQRYLRANGRGPNQQAGYTGPRGEWVSGDQGQGGGAQPGGSWVSSDGGQPSAPPSGGGGGGWAGGSPSPPPQPQGSSQEIEEIKDEISELKEATTQLMRAQRRSSGNDKQEVQSLKEKYQEMIEIHQTLEDMHGDDGQDEAVQALQNELQDMKRELARAEEAAADDGGTINVSDDGGGFGLIAKLAADGDADPETLEILAESMGTTDPEVKKAEYEFKAERERMKNRQELMDNFFDNLGDVSGDLVGAAMQMFQGGDDEDSTDGGNQGAAPNQQQPPGGGAGGQGVVDEWGGTRPAGATNMEPGEIQVVGDEEPDPQQSSGNGESGLSPARQRAESLEDDGSSIGGFRSPGDGGE